MGTYGVVGGMTYTGDTHAQKASRRYVRKKDQHGRRWGMSVEGLDGGRCGSMELQWPRGKARPPILPPDQWMRHAKPQPGGDPDEFTENLVFIDYPAWKNDIRTAWVDLTKRVHEEYAKRNIECDWSPTGTAPMRMDVREIVGPDPDPIEPVLACEQGNRWAIRGEGPMPKALAPWFRARQQIKSVLGAREFVDFDEAEEDPMQDAVAAVVAHADAETDLEERFDPAAAIAARLRQAKPKNKGGRPRKYPKDE